jgi:DNA-binding transcriptional regulator GbsR (MarR family)
MEIQEGKNKFIETWGTLSSQWGINRSMAQVHALLLVATSAMSADEIMQALEISRGNANTNIRALMDWGLVYKELRTGDRREYFYAEKDIWQVFKKIVTQRKKRELEPVLRILDELSNVEKNDKEAEEFIRVVQDIKKFACKADSTLDSLVKADSNWVMGALINVMMK